MADRRRRSVGQIGLRLALASVAVAVGALAVLSALTLVAARGDVSQLARQEQDQAAAAIASAATDAYRAVGSWTRSDLGPSAILAANSQASLTILDATGQTVAVPAVAGSAPPRPPAGPVRHYPVVVDGTKVGTVVVHFYRASLPTPETNLRDALGRTVAAGAGLGVLIALVVAVLLSRWITRPIVALTAAARAMGRGERGARVDATAGDRGELGELATAFNDMAETIAQEDELRRAVVADVAHELRTPLAILQASTESLVDGGLEASASVLASLHEEVLRLGRIVEDLDALASAEAAVLRLDMRPVDLADIAVHSIEALRPLYLAAGVELIDNLRSTAALADPDRMGQILHNLLTNALKFSGPGRRVTVTVLSEDGTALLEVADNGIGIPDDELPHVFERFWRGKHAGRVAGTGIGLAVVDALVKAHGGSVDVTSTTTEGTRFTIRMPRASREPA